MLATEELLSISASGQWQEGMKTAITVRDFHPFHTDEPEEMGGTDTAPNPMEYVLGGLCGCTSIMINMIAGEMNFKFSELQVSAAGTIDPRGILGTAEVSPHFQEVKQTIRLKTGETQQRVEELRRQVEKRCPAINLFRDAKIKPQTVWEKN